MGGGSTNQLDINFPGKISSETFRILVVEIIKQLMYQREQIPLPIDQLQSTIFNSNANDQKLSRVTPQLMKTGRAPVELSTRAQGTAKRQIIQAYETYSLLFHRLSDVFQLADIYEVIILMGPTIVSPRELYHVQRAGCGFCSLHELPSLPVRKCMPTLFKELITNSSLWSNKNLPLTNTTVLLKLNSECLSPDVDFLEPMHTFNPTRTVPQHIFINLNAQCLECETSIVSESVTGQCQDLEERLHLNSIQCESDNFMWVKVNPTLKGLKNSVFKK